MANRAEHLADFCRASIHTQTSDTRPQALLGHGHGIVQIYSARSIHPFIGIQSHFRRCAADCGRDRSYGYGRPWSERERAAACLAPQGCRGGYRRDSVFRPRSGILPNAEFFLSLRLSRIAAPIPLLEFALMQASKVLLKSAVDQRGSVQPGWFRCVHFFPQYTPHPWTGFENRRSSDRHSPAVALPSVCHVIDNS